MVRGLCAPNLLVFGIRHVWEPLTIQLRSSASKSDGLVSSEPIRPVAPAISGELAFAVRPSPASVPGPTGASAGAGWPRDERGGQQVGGIHRQRDQQTGLTGPVPRRAPGTPRSPPSPGQHDDVPLPASPSAARSRPRPPVAARGGGRGQQARDRREMPGHVRDEQTGNQSPDLVVAMPRLWPGLGRGADLTLPRIRGLRQPAGG